MNMISRIRGLWAHTLIILSATLATALPAVASDPNAPGNVLSLRAWNVNGSATPRLTASFTMPFYTLSGNPIPADSIIYVKVSTTEGAVNAAGYAGLTMSIIVDALQGENTVRVVPYFRSLYGEESTVKAYAGLDIPAAPSVLTVTTPPDLSSMSVGWEAPVAGYHAATLQQDDPVGYDIYLDRTGEYLPADRPELWEYLGDNGTQTSFSYVYQEKGEQGLVRIGVRSRNGLGQCPELAVASEVLGESYRLPFSEDFEEGEGTPATKAWTFPQPYAEYEASWSFGALSAVVEDDTRHGVILRGQPGKKGRVGIPRFDTGGLERVTVTLDIYGGEDAAVPTLMALTRAAAGTALKLEEIDCGPGFSEWSCDLPLYCLGQRWVQLYVDFEFAAGATVGAIEGVKIEGIKAGVETVETASAAIRAERGALVFSGLDGAPYTVYNIDGTPCASGVVGGEEYRLSLPPGLYIARSGHVAAKLEVKP